MQWKSIAFSWCNVWRTWFLADIPTLKAYFGKGFKDSAFPGNTTVEQIDKAVVFDSLKRATKDTQKGPYGKDKHSFEILALINLQHVIKASLRARQFIAGMQEALN